MGRIIELDTGIGAYVNDAPGAPKGGLVVVQEIFGVNAHIRSVVDRFAAEGYTAIAPAFFDHLERGVELGYDEASFRTARELTAKITFDTALADVAAAARAIAAAGRIGCVGYCWGGTVAFLAALRLGLPGVSYYGARNVPFLGETPKAPVEFHFGENDGSIPPEAIEKHREALPDAKIYTYPTGHAFNRDVDPKVHDAESAKLALERTLDFFGRHLARA